MAHSDKGHGLPIDEITKIVIGQVSLYFKNLLGIVCPVSHSEPLPVYRIKDFSETSLISDGIALNAATSIKIADANPDRTFFNVNTDGDNQAVWIKLQAAEIDNDKKGIWIEAKIGSINSWQMPTDSIYTGEICAISNNGTPKVFVTEY